MIFIYPCGRIIVSKKIKKLRVKERLSQQEVANFCGCSRNTISLIENGKFLPSLGMCYAFSVLFKCTIEDMIEVEK